MDDIVKAGLKKWPNVPHCRGWLGLDARGQWYLRDEQTQQAGAFPAVKGSLIVNDKLREFIARNYEADAAGGWFFQNGPQRVYVDLEAAPWVLGVHAVGDGFAWATHTGLPVCNLTASLVDEQGRLYMATEHGLGVVRSTDMLAASQALEHKGWEPEAVLFASLPSRFGYVCTPVLPSASARDHGAPPSA